MHKFLLNSSACELVPARLAAEVADHRSVTASMLLWFCLLSRMQMLNCCHLLPIALLGMIFLTVLGVFYNHWQQRQCWQQAWAALQVGSVQLVSRGRGGQTAVRGQTSSAAAAGAVESGAGSSRSRSQG